MIIRVIKSHSFYLGLLVIICLAVYLSIYKIEEHLDILKKKNYECSKICSSILSHRIWGFQIPHGC
jgi:hypothetical protein